ncbi:MAG TPA: sensor histidine kinase [Xanthomonadaceae bacterium]|nr:sensor histidine kinase [Xanthomonadaceae bacterium]
MNLRPPLPQRLRAWFAPAPDSAVADAIARGKSPWVDAVHLLWSVWVFITPVFGPGYSWRWAVLTALSYPVFLVLYAKVLLAPRRRAWGYAAAMLALCLALLPVYPSGMSYYIFGCVLLGIGRRDRLPAALGRLVLLGALFVAVAWAIGYPPHVLLWIPAVALVVGIIVHVENASHLRDAELKLSQDEVRRLAATAERERIGRDLHDLLGHTLSLITLKLELARKLAARDAEASLRELTEAERVARHALAEVRSAVTGIRSADLAAELASARLLLESSRTHLDYAPPPPDLPPEIERALALVLREAATNVARHARASRVQVACLREGKAVELIVRDDGVGGVARDGNGLAGMRDRVRALGGTLAIESPRGQGTVLRVRVPLSSAAPAPAEAPAPASSASLPQAPA